MKVQEAQIKEARKTQEALERFGLTNLSNANDIASVKNIVAKLSGNEFLKVGGALTGGDEKTLLKIQMHYQEAIVEQNFIMIRQLDRIAKALEK